MGYSEKRNSEVKRNFSLLRNRKLPQPNCPSQEVPCSTSATTTPKKANARPHSQQRLINSFSSDAGPRPPHSRLTSHALHLQPPHLLSRAQQIDHIWRQPHNSQHPSTAPSPHPYSAAGRRRSTAGCNGSRLAASSCVHASHSASLPIGRVLIRLWREGMYLSSAYS